MEGGLMSSTDELLTATSLEQQRKRAKELRRWHREGRTDAAERIAQHLPRLRGRPAAEVLAAAFTLSEAQLVVAREAGYPSWPALKHALDRLEECRGADEEVIIEAALAGDDSAAAAAFAKDPQRARSHMPVAAVLADEEAVLALVTGDPLLADRPAGRRGWTPLLYLCCSRYRRRDEEVSRARARIARRLLDLGADVHAVAGEAGYTTANVTVFDEHQWAALDGAAGRAASPELLRTLLDGGAHAKKAGSLLTRAVESGDLEILRLALGAGPPWWQVHHALVACVELDRPEMARLLVAHAQTARSLDRPLREAIRSGRDASMIEILLGDGRSEMSMPVWREAYRSAVRFAHAGAAALLKARGVSDDAASDVDRLIGACVTGDREQVKRLTAALAPVSRRLSLGDHRAIAWAIRRGRDEAVALLVDAGLDPNVADRDGQSPLHLAVRAGTVAIVETLLKAGAVADARDFDGRTPLGAALLLPQGGARDEISRRLIAAGASSVAMPDREDMDQLFERAADAVAFGDLEGLRALLDEEPALVHARSPRPHRATLLNYCGANGTEEPRQRTPANAPAIAQLLLERGADPNAECKLYGGGWDTMNLMLTSANPAGSGLDGELVRVLARGGARIQTVAGDGPIDTAIAYGLSRSVKALVDAGVPVDNLLVAAAVGRLDVLEELLARGEDVNTRFAFGCTALHAAACLGQVEAAALLLRHGAEPRLRESRWGGTPVENARHIGLNEVADLIETYGG
jgi:ankyrin repeat protein